MFLGFHHTIEDWEVDLDRGANFHTLFPIGTSSYAWMRGLTSLALSINCESSRKERLHFTRFFPATGHGFGPRANKVGVRDGDGSLLRQPVQPAVFILPAACRCRSRAIPQNALSGAKDLPTTVLSGHGVSVAGQSFEKVSDVKAACSGGGVTFHS
jgi:hypothetical protein